VHDTCALDAVRQCTPPPPDAHCTTPQPDAALHDAVPYRFLNAAVPYSYADAARSSSTSLLSAPPLTR
jgi:hypothetical protein